VYTAVGSIGDQGDHLGTIPAPPQEAAFENTILMVSPHRALEQAP
jgi:hypothetical protein